MSWHPGMTPVVEDVIIIPRLFAIHLETFTNSGKQLRKAKTGAMEGPHESKVSSGSFVSARMPFIVSSNIEKVDPATRKLIRSHVMRGKKQKRGRSSRDGRTTSRVAISGRTRVARVKLEEAIEMYTPPIPGRVGSDVSLVELPDGIESLMVESMLKGL